MIYVTSGFPSSLSQKYSAAACVFVLSLIFLCFFSPQAFAYTTNNYGGVSISDGVAGGECYLVGLWDASTKTCTLTTDIQVGVSNGNGIVIRSSGITLDGNGHRISGATPSGGTGIYLVNTSNSVIRNIRTSVFHQGLIVDSASASNYIVNTETTSSSLGIMVYGPGNVLSGNRLTENVSYGIRLERGSNNSVITGNFLKNSTFGLYVMSNGNLITENEINIPASAYTPKGIYLSYAHDNVIYHNNFLAIPTFPMPTLAYDDGMGGGNLFYLPAPVGGNYWNLWRVSTDRWITYVVCPDSNLDGFADSTYSAGIVLDNLPWAAKNGWRYSRPRLTLAADRVFWANYADFQLRSLSIEYAISNTGSDDAKNVQITSTNASNGVICSTATPVMLGSIVQGSTLASVLRYTVPTGTASFKVNVTAQAQNAGNVAYNYPG